MLFDESNTRDARSDLTGTTAWRTRGAVHGDLALFVRISDNIDTRRHPSLPELNLVGLDASFPASSPGTAPWHLESGSHVQARYPFAPNNEFHGLASETGWSVDAR